LNDDDESTDTPAVATPLLTAFYVRDDKRITNICPWDDMSGSYGESTMRFSMMVITQFDE
jgi:hypothetical protein